MRAFIVLAVIGATLAAPTENERDVQLLEEVQRTKKSPYGGGPPYGISAGPIAAPCAGAAPLSPVQFFALAPQAVAPAAAPLHYREDEHFGLEQKARAEENARYYDSSAAASAAAIQSAAAAAAAGAASAAAAGAASAAAPAMGVFPNARVSDCAVPLLLSCAPSVTSGHLSHASYGAGYGSAVAPLTYRAPESSHVEHNNKMREAEMEKAATEHQTAQSWEHSAMPTHHHHLHHMHPVNLHV